MQAPYSVMVNSIQTASQALSQYVFNLSKGRVRYIIETVEQLLWDNHIEVTLCFPTWPEQNVITRRKR